MLPLEADTRRNFEDSLKFIEAFAKSGRVKFQAFVRYKTSEIIYLWEELLEIVTENEASGNAEYDIYEKRSDIKLLIRIIYGNIDYLQQFISLNRKIEKCIEDAKRMYV